MVMVVPSRVTSVCAGGLRTGLAGSADCDAGMSMLDDWAEALRVAAKARARRSEVQRAGFFMAVMVLPGY
jgi:hypothetical protein